MFCAICVCFAAYERSVIYGSCKVLGVGTLYICEDHLKEGSDRFGREGMLGFCWLRRR